MYVRDTEALYLLGILYETCTRTLSFKHCVCERYTTTVPLGIVYVRDTEELYLLGILYVRHTQELYLLSIVYVRDTQQLYPLGIVYVRDTQQLHHLCVLYARDRQIISFVIYVQQLCLCVVYERIKQKLCVWCVCETCIN